MRRSARFAHAAVSCLVAASYGTLACALTWPLPLHLRTRLLGDPAGDLGVYVWNLWIFRHELIGHAHLPFSTDHVFGVTGPPDFSLHNYAPLAGALGAPLIGTFGVVAAFNLVMLTSMALTGIATFALARRLGLGGPAAWWAGALFMASPVLTAKETAHFSLVLAAPLPLFLWALLRALDSRRTRDALLVGAVAAAASYSDAYYGIYCGLMGLVLVAFRFLRLEWPERPEPWRRATLALNAVLVLVVTVVAIRGVLGPERLALGPVSVSLQTWYTPLLLLVAAGVLRAWLPRRPRVRLDGSWSEIAAFVPLGLIAIAACLVLLLPEITGLAIRLANGRLPDTQVFWRTSPRGLDALAYLVPNPSHAWFGDWTRHWFMPPEPDAFPELVASFSFVALALVAVGAWRRALPRLWVVFTVTFVALSLGPFIQVAGMNTYVIGPWALLRYVPVIGMARSPARFAILAALGLALLAAYAIDEIRVRRVAGRWAGAMAALLAAVAAFELIPAPRQLHSASVPGVYGLVSARATGDEAGRLLELPTGIRDGTSSLGDFSALSSYYQTSHGRPMVGGYLSRVSKWRKEEKLRLPMFRALMTLSERRPLPAVEAQQARDARDRFLRRSCARFVMVDTRRASAALRAFAIDALRLTLVAEDGAFALYRPVDPPACDPPSARRLSDVSWLWQPGE